MKKILSMVAVVFVISFLLLQVALPNSLLAATGSVPSGIDNPIKATSIQALIAAVLQFVVNLLAIAGVLYIIWSGFLFVKAQGNPSELEKAKKSFMNAIIGMAIILAAWAIATMIANTINQITGNKDATFQNS